MNDLWTPDDGMGIPEGSIGRLLEQLTVTSHTRIRQKDAAENRHALKEVEQQFQFLLSGTAATAISFEEVTIPFDYAFHYAPAQRESNLEYPHFTYGSQTSPPVGIHATVTQWMHDQPTGSINGAVVAVGVHGAGDFTGVVHLTFQGYGALIEEGEEKGAE